MPNSIIILMVAVFLYPVICGLVLRLNEGARNEFADLARKMLTDPSVNEDHKRLISSMIDDIFDWRFMAKASVVFPFVAFFRKIEDELTPADKQFIAREDAERLGGLHMRLVMSASPFFTVVFFVLAAVTLPAKLSFSMVRFALIWADTVKSVSPLVGTLKYR